MKSELKEGWKLREVVILRSQLAMQEKQNWEAQNRIIACKICRYGNWSKKQVNPCICGFLGTFPITFGAIVFLLSCTPLHLLLPAMKNRSMTGVPMLRGWVTGMGRMRRCRRGTAGMTTSWRRRRVTVMTRLRARLRVSESNVIHVSCRAGRLGWPICSCLLL